MIDQFIEAVKKIESRSIIDWKDNGKRVVGYTCSYVPVEVLHSAGVLPVRLRGIGTQRLQIGDAYFGPYICSFPKCILQLAGEGRFSFLDGTIITPGCDSMRRLDECWRKAGNDFKGIVPDFFYYLDVPHKTEPHGTSWFEKEIRKLIVAVEGKLNVQITPENLKNSINLFNKGRRLLARMGKIRAQNPESVSGTEAFAITVAGTVMPREEYTSLLENFLDKIDSHQVSGETERKIRLMVMGSISDDMDLIELIEDADNTVISAENLCFGVRFDGNEIDENSDPVNALAEGYLGESACPRMYGKYKQRLASVMEVIARAHIDGVILQNIRFCDLHGSENSLFERDLESKGIPCLKIEREYGPLVETGRIRMRLDPFLERIGR